MKKLRLGMFILLALILSISLVAIGCPAEEKEAKELPIGALEGLSGAGSESMAHLADGIRAAADWINENGGLTINGEKYLVKLIEEDYKMSVEGMVAAANKLIYEDQVKFIVDGCPVPPFKAALGLMCEDNKIVRIDVSDPGSITELTPEMTYTFADHYDRVNFAEAIANFLTLYPDVKTAGLVNAEDPAGYEMSDYIKEYLSEYDREVVSEEYFPFGTADFYPMWTNILAAEPDSIIMILGMPEWYGAIIKQGRELGYTGPFLGTGTGGGDPYVTLAIAGKEFSTDILYCSWDFNSPEMTPMIKEMRSYIKDKFGVELRSDHIIGRETLWALTQAIEEAQSLDPTVVRDTFEKMTSIETPNGTGKLGGLVTYGINHMLVRPHSLSRIMNGEVSHFRWFTPELP
jgi:branched-chain amino acid transport system substrate-binding protein